MAPLYIYAVKMIGLRAEVITPSGGYGPISSHFGGWSAVMLSGALTARACPSGLVLQALHLPLGLVLQALGLVLQALHLPLVPGCRARHHAGPVILADPPQRLHRYRSHGNPFLKAAASQQMVRQAQRDQ